MLLDITHQEFGNILAGLVLLQNHVDDEPLDDDSIEAVWEIATNVGTYADLTREELVELANRLSAQATEQEPRKSLPRRKPTH